VSQPTPVRSEAITRVIETTPIDDPKLAEMFRRCFPNTLETTTVLTDEDTYVITGDIDAMWLRDSSAQVHPYLPFCAEDETLRRVVTGLIRRQARYVNIDPYGNAFNFEPNGRGHQSDETDQSPWLWERKYEVDSLCYPIRLAYTYWKHTQDISVFTEEWLRAAQKIVETWRVEQDHTHSPYRFTRRNVRETDTLPNEGRGNPVAPTGMTWSGFRPSDDSCVYGYLIPSQMFAVVELAHLVEILHQVRYYRDEISFAAECQNLQSEIDRGIQGYGIVNHPEYGEIFAYEVDGMDNTLLMDDANVPSLLSIPYLGYTTADDPVYQTTRRFQHTQDNPYYHAGSAGKWIGSPPPPPGSVWHIAIIMQALTSTSEAEVRECLEILKRTDAGTGYMHESFNPNDPSDYTRSWFAWANTLFGELILKVYGKK
jgi:meiotically up-regulated gene 157 (Mug157) protein